MREISIRSFKPEESEKDEALEKIGEGLAMLAKLNANIAKELMGAIKAIPSPDRIDLKPLIDAMPKQKEPQAYEFKMERNSANLLTKATAIPV